MTNISGTPREYCIDNLSGTSREYFREKYFRDPERTRLAVDAEGWLHTGDIGEWQLNGTLKIIDRQAVVLFFNISSFVVLDQEEADLQAVAG